MSGVHRFRDTATIGKEGAERVCRHLTETRGFDFTPATMAEEWTGMDYRAKRPGRDDCTIEVKTDTRANGTGNAFIEGVSNDKSGRPGWAHTCSADFLLYYVTGAEAVYVLHPADVRDKIPKWEEEYQRRPAQNAGFRTIGVCVPLRELEAIAEGVVSL